MAKNYTAASGEEDAIPVPREDKRRLDTESVHKLEH